MLSVLVGMLVLSTAADPDTAASASTPAPPQTAMTPSHEAGRRIFTLPEALDFARRHQPSIKAARAQVQQSHASALVPRRQWLPALGVNAQAFYATSNNSPSTTTNSPVVTLPRISSTQVVRSGNMHAYGSTLAAVGLNQEVFDFGRIAAEAAEADAQVEVARWSLQARHFELQFGVEEAYFAVLAAKSIQIASDDAYKRARMHRDVAKASVDVGLRSPVELARTTALLGHFDVGRIRSQGGVQIAQTVLATAIGIPDEPVDTAGPAPQFGDMPTLQAAMQMAAERNPAILQALARLQAQQGRTRAIGASLRPNLVLTATLSGSAGGAGAVHPEGDGWLPAIVNWDVGLMLNWPLFDGVVRAREQAALAQQQVLREDYYLARQTQSSALQQGFIDFDVARASLPALRQAVEAATDNYNQANAQFEAGLRDSVELADAENIRVDAEIQLALGRFAVARARAAFGRLIAEEAFVNVDR